MLSIFLSNNSTQAASVSSTGSVHAALITKSVVSYATGLGKGKNRHVVGRQHKKTTARVEAHVTHVPHVPSKHNAIMIMHVIMIMNVIYWYFTK